MRRSLLVLATAMFFLTGSQVYSQGRNLHRSIFGQQPFSLPQKSVLVTVRGAFPTILKMYNPAADQMQDVPATMVLNEANYTGFVEYGLFRSLTVYASLPLRFVHYFSPDLNQIGKGLGNVETGVYYQFFSRDGESGLLTDLSLTLPTSDIDFMNTGKYPLGSTAWEVKGGLTGLLPLNGAHLLLNAAYRFRTEDNVGVNIGDEINGTLLYQKRLDGKFGNFLIEAGVAAADKFEDSKGGTNLSGTDDFQTQLLLGTTFFYNKNLQFRLGLPYTFYQKGGWFTRYSVFIQIDYLLNALKQRSEQ